MKAKKLKIIKSTKKKHKKNSINLNKEDLNKIFELNNFEIFEKVEPIKREVPNNKNDELNRLLKGETISHYYPIKSDKIQSVKKYSKQQKLVSKNFKPVKKTKKELISPHLLDLKELGESTADLIENKFNSSLKDVFSPLKQSLLKKIKNGKNFHFSKFNINFRFKIAVNFLAACLLLITPIYSISLLANLDIMKDKVYIQGVQAITELENATKSTLNNNYYQAISDFDQAAINFSEAREILDNYNNLLWKIANYLPGTNKKINSAKNILSAGQKISQAAGSLTNLLNNFELKDDSLTLTEKISALKNNLVEISEQLELVHLSLASLNENLIPNSYQEEFVYFQSQLPNLLLNLEAIQKNLEVTYKILAPDNKKQYLVFFQNTNEIRGTGGFLGSFALVTIKNGEIIKMEIPGGGPYDLKGNMTEKIISPKPMHLVGSRWQIWDANWWPDFPTSAQKIIWFYEAGGGLTVDGVITINSDILPQLLQLTGDIYMEKYEKLMTSDNVITMLQYAVEYEYDKEKNKPKQIIADLTPILIDKLLNIEGSKMSEFLNILITALKEKNIQMYFTENDLENKIINLNWDGSVKDTTGDYLMVVNQNIGGGKTDAVINQKINLDSEILTNGTIYNTLSITRKHLGRPGDIFEKINNVSYIRVYVPEGSELLEISGYNPPPLTAYKNIEADYYEDEFFKDVSGQIYQDEKSGTDINSEFGKTVFGHWLQVNPGEEATLTIKYKLPFKLKQSSQQVNLITKIIDFFQPKNQELKNYNLLIQKQSGSKNIIQGSVDLPDNKRIVWADSTKNQTLEIQGNSIFYSSSLLTDQSYAVIVD